MIVPRSPIQPSQNYIDARRLVAKKKDARIERALLAFEKIADALLRIAKTEEKKYGPD